MFVRSVTVFFLLCLCASVEAALNQSVNPPNKKTINWMVHDVPPFVLVNSTDTVVEPATISGPLGGLYKVLAMSMPEYEHRFVRLPIARTMKFIKEKKQICSLIVLESKERHEFMTFGAEVSIGLPLGLVTLKDIASEKYVLSNPDMNEVTITKTLEKNKFKLGFIGGRYYSPEIMPLLEKSKNSYGILSDGSITKLLSMLEARRIDGVFAVYLEMAEYERAHPGGPKMQFMRLKEAPDFMALRVSCEKTAWGEKAMRDISKVVREKNFKEISNSYLLSVLPAERRKEYQKIYESRPPPAPWMSKE